MNDYKSSRKLYWLAAIIILLSIGTTAFAIWYQISNQTKFNHQLQDVKDQLSRYNIPQSTQANITNPTEAQYLLSVAKYCDANNKCKGDDGQSGTVTVTQLLQPVVTQQVLAGKDGLTPKCYFEASQCQGADGKTPDCYSTDTKCVGPKGDTGNTGAPGNDAPRTERRCNADAHRIEWRLAGDEAWQVEYNLAIGQTCPSENKS